MVLLWYEYNDFVFSQLGLVRLDYNEYRCAVNVFSLLILNQSPWMLYVGQNKIDRVPQNVSSEFSTWMVGMVIIHCESPEKGIINMITDTLMIHVLLYGMYYILYIYRVDNTFSNMNHRTAVGCVLLSTCLLRLKVGKYFSVNGTLHGTLAYTRGE